MGLNNALPNTYYKNPDPLSFYMCRAADVKDLKSNWNKSAPAASYGELSVQKGQAAAPKNTRCGRLRFSFLYQPPVWTYYQMPCFA